MESNCLDKCYSSDNPDSVGLALRQ